ncbi:MAG: glycosyltransferase family 4 protein [Pseudomonadota bacterium]
MINRILLIISSLSPGGAERVMTNMANYWSGKGVKVNLITFDDGSAPPFYDLDPQVNHLPLGILGYSSNPGIGLWNNLRRIHILRQTIRSQSPDMIISFIDLTNVLVLLACLGSKIPVLVSEHSDPAVTPIGPLWRGLRLWTYSRAGQVVVLNLRAKSYFPVKIQKQTTIIPNPVLLEERGSIKDETLHVPTVLAMGRISAEKRMDILIQAFALIKDRHPDWRLVILGDGPLRSDLEGLRDRLDLSSRVHFLGVVKNPYPILRKGDLFVLSSRFEGFPMALCEAMACGLPVISSEYHEGVREIVREGIDGLLVPPGDVGALAEALDRLMSDEAERKQLGRRGVEIVERFGLKKIMDQWENLIERVGGNRSFKA